MGVVYGLSKPRVHARMTAESVEPRELHIEI